MSKKEAKQKTHTELLEKHVYKYYYSKSDHEYKDGVTQAMVNNYFSTGPKIIHTTDKTDIEPTQGQLLQGGRMLEDTIEDLSGKRALTGGNQLQPKPRRNVYPFSLY